jgi:energy-coupling factor transport system permease protein
VNPLAKFVAASIVGISLLLTISTWAAVIVLVVDLIALAFARLAPRRVAQMLLPLLVMSVVSSASTVLYGRPGGDVFWTWGLICISQGSIYLALAIGLRILAIGIPGVVLASTIDPTHLADSLTQLWRAPRRFVMGTLAAFRLLGLFLDDWRSLTLARRARGLGSGRGPCAAVARTLNQAFSLLVLSMRRAATLALAMEARGMNTRTAHTNARTAIWTQRDWMFVAASVVVAALALTAAFVQTHSGGV